MTIIKQEKIDVSQPSNIHHFATTSMIETFLMGVSPDVYATTLTELEKSLTNFADRIKGSLGIADIFALETYQKEPFEQYRSVWTGSAIETHLSIQPFH